LTDALSLYGCVLLDGRHALDVVVLQLLQRVVVILFCFLFSFERMRYEESVPQGRKKSSQVTWMRVAKAVVFSRRVCSSLGS